MKTMLLVIAGMVAVAVVLVGGGVYWFSHTKLDFNNAQVTAKFKENFDSSCLANFQKGLESRGITPNDAQREKMNSICICSGDGVVDAVAKRGGMTVTEMAIAMKDDPEIKNITRSCAAMNGVTIP